jgi:hypothetical protein
VAQAGFNDLLETPYASENAINILPKLIIPIKNALVNFLFVCFFLWKKTTIHLLGNFFFQSSEDDAIFVAGMNALGKLSDAVGPYLNQYIKIYLSIVSQFLGRSFN